jgi:tRNA1Val (adenine37-N6)-methyltransferase
MNKTLGTIIKENLFISQPDKGFRFSSDSVYLAWFVRKKKNAKVLDIGSGSGVVSVLLAGMKDFNNIDAVEFQTEMFECLRESVDKSGLNEVIKTYNQDIKDFVPDSKYDVIVSNPPYKKADSGRLPENKTDLYARFTKTMCADDVFRFSASWLKEGGSLYLSYDAESVSDLFDSGTKHGFEAKKIMPIYGDLDKRPKIVLMEFRKGAGRELIFEPPFFQKINGEISDLETKIMGGDWD